MLQRNSQQVSNHGKKKKKQIDGDSGIASRLRDVFGASATPAIPAIVSQRYLMRSKLQSESSSKHLNQLVEQEIRCTKYCCGTADLLRSIMGDEKGKERTG